MPACVHFYFALITLFASGVAHGEEESTRSFVPVTLQKDVFYLNHDSPERELVIRQGGWRYIDKIFFRASTERRGSRIAVLADGEIRCEHDLNTHESGFTCSIERTTSEIALRHIKGGQVIVVQMKSYQSPGAPSKMTTRKVEDILSSSTDFDRIPRRIYPPEEDVDEVIPPKGNVAGYLADRAVQAVQLLFRRLSDEWPEQSEETKQILSDLNNIKIVAAQAKAVARPNKDFSFSTLFAMLKLQKQIDGMGETITQLLKRRDTYPLALQLITVREFIEDRLDTHKLDLMLEKDADSVKKLLAEEGSR